MLAAQLLEEKAKHTVNIAEGFEGDPDENRHRGNLNGWRYICFPGNRLELVLLCFYIKKTLILNHRFLGLDCARCMGLGLLLEEDNIKISPETWTELYEIVQLLNN